MVCTRTKKHQNRRRLNQLNKTLNASFIGNDTNVDTVESEAIEPQSSGIVKISGNSTAGGNIESHDEVTEKKMLKKIRKRLTMQLRLSKVEPMTPF